MATSWFSALRAAEPPAPSKADLANDAGSFESMDDCASAKENHQGIQSAFLSSEINRLCASMTERMETQIRNTGDRLRNLERLTEVQGQALKHIMASMSEPTSQTTAKDSPKQEPTPRGLPLLQAELDTHKVLVDRSDMRLRELSDEVATLRATLKGLDDTRAGSWSQEPNNNAMNIVTFDRYQQDLITMAIDRDLVMIKASYLAIASTESTSAEKKKIYDQLVNAESSLRNRRPVSELPLPDGSSFSFLAGSSAPTDDALRDSPEFADCHLQARSTHDAD